MKCIVQQCEDCILSIGVFCFASTYQCSKFPAHVKLILSARQVFASLSQPVGLHGCVFRT